MRIRWGFLLSDLPNSNRRQLEHHPHIIMKHTGAENIIQLLERLGTMGFGLPAAIGAPLKKPDATVVCFAGDGSLLMNIQELITAVEEDANVKIILSNNNSLGWVHQQQDLLYNKQISTSQYHRAVDFPTKAEGLQMKAYDIGTCTDPASTLAEAFAQSGPALINVPIEVQQHVFPMVPPGGANKEILTSSGPTRECANGG